MKPVPLVGQYFHSFQNEKIQWQGAVIGNPESGWYLLQLCEWFFGEPVNRRLVRIEDMKNFIFYADSDEMKEAYDTKYSKTK